MLPETDNFIAVGNDFNKKIDTSQLLKESILNYNKQKLDWCSERLREALEYSKKEFSAASDAHFELEKIYSATMNFAEIDSVCKKITCEIEETLDDGL